MVRCQWLDQSSLRKLSLVLPEVVREEINRECLPTRPLLFRKLSQPFLSYLYRAKASLDFIGGRSPSFRPSSPTLVKATYTANFVWVMTIFFSMMMSPRFLLNHLRNRRWRLCCYRGNDNLGWYLRGVASQAATVISGRRKRRVYCIEEGIDRVERGNLCRRRKKRAECLLGMMTSPSFVSRLPAPAALSWRNGSITILYFSPLM